MTFVKAFLASGSGLFLEPVRNYPDGTRERVWAVAVTAHLVLLGFAAAASGNNPARWVDEGTRKKGGGGTTGERRSLSAMAAKENSENASRGRRKKKKKKTRRLSPSPHSLHFFLIYLSLSVSPPSRSLAAPRGIRSAPEGSHPRISDDYRAQAQQGQGRSWPASPACRRQRQSGRRRRFRLARHRRRRPTFRPHLVGSALLSLPSRIQDGRGRREVCR